MKFAARLVLIAVFLVLSTSVGNAQATIIGSDAARQERARERRNEVDLERRMNDMRALEPLARRQVKRDVPVIKTPELDKFAKERVMKMRRIDPSDLGAYADFSKKEKTGIFKLFPNLDCLTPNLIRLDGGCVDFVPLSSDFSFREVGYTDGNYHDIGFDGQEFVSKAFFSQGIFVSFGDIPIREIGQENEALRYLAEFQPSVKQGEAKKAAKKFEYGFETKGFKYANRIAATEGTTYGLRIIAYKMGSSVPPPTANSSMIEMKFLSLQFDKRVDMTVVFRIIRKEANGGITIVWKELARSDAPSIKFAENEVLADFKPRD